MDSDYIVFWLRGAEQETRVNVVRVTYPPHLPPVGSGLEEMLAHSLPGISRLMGAVQLPPIRDHQGMFLTFTIGDGIAWSVSATPRGWAI